MSEKLTVDLGDIISQLSQVDQGSTQLAQNIQMFGAQVTSQLDAISQGVATVLGEQTQAVRGSMKEMASVLSQANGTVQNAINTSSVSVRNISRQMATAYKDIADLSQGFLSKDKSVRQRHASRIFREYGVDTLSDNYEFNLMPQGARNRLSSVFQSRVAAIGTGGAYIQKIGLDAPSLKALMASQQGIVRAANVVQQMMTSARIGGGLGSAQGTNTRIFDEKFLAQGLFRQYGRAGIEKAIRKVVPDFKMEMSGSDDLQSLIRIGMAQSGKLIGSGVGASIGSNKQLNPFARMVAAQTQRFFSRQRQNKDVFGLFSPELSRQVANRVAYKTPTPVLNEDEIINLTKRQYEAIEVAAASRQGQRLRNALQHAGVYKIRDNGTGQLARSFTRSQIGQVYAMLADQYNDVISGPTHDRMDYLEVQKLLHSKDKDERSRGRVLNNRMISRGTSTDGGQIIYGMQTLNTLLPGIQVPYSPNSIGYNTTIPDVNIKGGRARNISQSVVNQMFDVPQYSFSQALWMQRNKRGAGLTHNGRNVGAQQQLYNSNALTEAIGLTGNRTYGVSEEYISQYGQPIIRIKNPQTNGIDKQNGGFKYSDQDQRQYDRMFKSSGKFNIPTQTFYDQKGVGHQYYMIGSHQSGSTWINEQAYNRLQKRYGTQWSLDRNGQVVQGSAERSFAHLGFTTAGLQQVMSQAQGGSAYIGKHYDYQNKAMSSATPVYKLQGRNQPKKFEPGYWPGLPTQQGGAQYNNQLGNMAIIDIADLQRQGVGDDIFSESFAWDGQALILPEYNNGNSTGMSRIPGGGIIMRQGFNGFKGGLTTADWYNTVRKIAQRGEDGQYHFYAKTLGKNPDGSNRYIDLMKQDDSGNPFYTTIMPTSVFKGWKGVVDFLAGNTPQTQGLDADTTSAMLSRNIAINPLMATATAEQFDIDNMFINSQTAKNLTFGSDIYKKSTDALMSLVSNRERLAQIVAHSNPQYARMLQEDKTAYNQHAGFQKQIDNYAAQLITRAAAGQIYKGPDSGLQGIGNSNDQTYFGNPIDVITAIGLSNGLLKPRSIEEVAQRYRQLHPQYKNVKAEDIIKKDLSKDFTFNDFIDLNSSDKNTADVLRQLIMPKDVAFSRRLQQGWINLQRNPGVVGDGGKAFIVNADSKNIGDFNPRQFAARYGYSNGIIGSRDLAYGAGTADYDGDRLKWLSDSLGHMGNISMQDYLTYLNQDKKYEIEGTPLFNRNLAPQFFEQIIENGKPTGKWKIRDNSETRFKAFMNSANAKLIMGQASDAGVAVSRFRDSQLGFLENGQLGSEHTLSELGGALKAASVLYDRASSDQKKKALVFHVPQFIRDLLDKPGLGLDVSAALKHYNSAIQIKEPTGNDEALTEQQAQKAQWKYENEVYQAAHRKMLSEYTLPNVYGSQQTYQQTIALQKMYESNSPLVLQQIEKAKRASSIVARQKFGQQAYEQNKDYIDFFDNVMAVVGFTGATFTDQQRKQINSKYKQFIAANDWRKDDDPIRKYINKLGLTFGDIGAMYKRGSMNTQEQRNNAAKMWAVKDQIVNSRNDQDYQKYLQQHPVLLTQDEATRKHFYHQDIARRAYQSDAIKNLAVAPSLSSSAVFAAQKTNADTAFAIQQQERKKLQAQRQKQTEGFKQRQKEAQDKQKQEAAKQPQKSVVQQKPQPPVMQPKQQPVATAQAQQPQPQAKQKLSAQDRTQAVKLASESSVKAAADKYGVSQSTIRNWMKDERYAIKQNVQTPQPANPPEVVPDNSPTNPQPANTPNNVQPTNNAFLNILQAQEVAQMRDRVYSNVGRARSALASGDFFRAYAALAPKEVQGLSPITLESKLGNITKQFGLYQTSGQYSADIEQLTSVRDQINKSLLESLKSDNEEDAINKMLAGRVSALIQRNSKKKGWTAGLAQSQANVQAAQLAIKWLESKDIQSAIMNMGQQQDLWMLGQRQKALERLRSTQYSNTIKSARDIQGGILDAERQYVGLKQIKTNPFAAYGEQRDLVANRIHQLNVQKEVLQKRFNSANPAEVSILNERIAQIDNVLSGENGDGGLNQYLANIENAYSRGERYARAENGLNRQNWLRENHGRTDGGFRLRQFKKERFEAQKQALLRQIDQQLQSPTIDNKQRTRLLRQREEINDSKFHSQMLSPGAMYALRNVGSTVLHGVQSVTNNAMGTDLGIKIPNIMNMTSRAMAVSEILSSIAVSITNFVNSMVQNVKVLDKTATQIQMITGQSRQESRRHVTDAYNLASQLGVSATDTAKASVALYRQGLSTAQVRDRLQTATKFGVVSGGGTQSAIKTITVALNSGLVQNAQQATDVLATLGDTAATTAEQIAMAMQRSAASSAQLGVSFNELATMIAVVSESTQLSGSSIGTFFKTTLARMNKLSSSGYVYDAQSGVTTSSNQFKNTMKSINRQLSANGMEQIKYLDQNGRILDSGTILRNLGYGWGNLNDQQRAAVTYAMSGTRSVDMMYALMQGIQSGRFDQLLQNANNSQGAVNKKYDAYQQSIQASQNRLANAKAMLGTDTLGGAWLSNAITDIQSFGLGILGGIANFGGSIGLLLSSDQQRQAYRKSNLQRAYQSSFSQNVKQAQTARANEGKYRQAFNLLKNYSNLTDTEKQYLNNQLQQLFGDEFADKISKLGGSAQQAADAIQQLSDAAKDGAESQKQKQKAAAISAITDAVVAVGGAEAYYKAGVKSKKQNEDQGQDQDESPQVRASILNEESSNISGYAKEYTEKYGDTQLGDKAASLYSLIQWSIIPNRQKYEAGLLNDAQNDSFKNAVEKAGELYVQLMEDDKFNTLVKQMQKSQESLGGVSSWDVDYTQTSGQDYDVNLRKQNVNKIIKDDIFPKVLEALGIKDTQEQLKQAVLDYLLKNADEIMLNYGWYGQDTNYRDRQSFENQIMAKKSGLTLDQNNLLAVHGTPVSDKITFSSDQYSTIGGIIGGNTKILQQMSDPSFWDGVLNGQQAVARIQQRMNQLTFTVSQLASQYKQLQQTSADVQALGMSQYFTELAKGGNSAIRATAKMQNEMRKLSHAQGLLDNAKKNGSKFSDDDAKWLAQYLGLPDAEHLSTSQVQAMLGNSAQAIADSATVLINDVYELMEKNPKFAEFNLGDILQMKIDGDDSGFIQGIQLIAQAMIADGQQTLRQMGQALLQFFVSGNPWVQFQFQTAAEQSGDQVSISANITGTNQGFSKGGGGGGKSKAKKLQQKFARQDRLYKHQIAMVQKQQDLAQQQMKLTDYGIYLQRQIELQKAHIPVLQQQIAQAEKQLKTMKAGTQAYDQMQELVYSLHEQLKDLTNTIQKNTQALRQNRSQIRKTTMQLEDTISGVYEQLEQRRISMLQGEVNIQQQIIDTITERYQREQQLIDQNIQAQRNALEQEKNLLSERLNARKAESEQQQKYNKLQQMRRQYSLLSMDPTRQNEAKKLAKQIADLQKQIAWDVASNEVDAQTNALQSEQDALDAYQKKVDDFYDNIFEHPQVIIEEAQAVMQQTMDQILLWLEQANEQFANSSTAMRQQMIDDWTQTIKQWKNITDTYWTQVNIKMAGSLQQFLELMMQTSDYINASDTNKQQMIYQWTKLWNNYHKAITDTAEPAHTQNHNTGSGGSGSGNGGQDYYGPSLKHTYSDQDGNFVYSYQVYKHNGKTEYKTALGEIFSDFNSMHSSQLQRVYKQKHSAAASETDEVSLQQLFGRNGTTSQQPQAIKTNGQYLGQEYEIKTYSNGVSTYGYSGAFYDTQQQVREQIAKIKEWTQSQAITQPNGGHQFSLQDIGGLQQQPLKQKDGLIFGKRYTVRTYANGDVKYYYNGKQFDDQVSVWNQIKADAASDSQQTSTSQPSAANQPARVLTHPANYGGRQYDIEVYSDGSSKFLYGGTYYNSKSQIQQVIRKQNKRQLLPATSNEQSNQQFNQNKLQLDAVDDWQREQAQAYAAYLAKKQAEKFAEWAQLQTPTAPKPTLNSAVAALLIGDKNYQVTSNQWREQALIFQNLMAAKKIKPAGDEQIPFEQLFGDSYTGFSQSGQQIDYTEDLRDITHNITLLLRQQDSMAVISQDFYNAVLDGTATTLDGFQQVGISLSNVMYDGNQTLQDLYQQLVQNGNDQQEAYKQMIDIYKDMYRGTVQNPKIEHILDNVNINNTEYQLQQLKQLHATQEQIDEYLRIVQQMQRERKLREEQQRKKQEEDTKNKPTTKPNLPQLNVNVFTDISTGAASDTKKGASGIKAVAFDVNSFDVGGYIDRNQIAIIHGGEYILTQQQVRDINNTMSKPMTFNAGNFAHALQDKLAGNGGYNIGSINVSVDHLDSDTDFEQLAARVADSINTAMTRDLSASGLRLGF